MTIFTRKFWEYALERAVKSAAQAASVYLAAGVVNLFEVNAVEIAGVTGLAFVASVFTSLGTPEDVRDARLAAPASD